MNLGYKCIKIIFELMGGIEGLDMMNQNTDDTKPLRKYPHEAFLHLAIPFW